MASPVEAVRAKSVSWELLEKFNYETGEMPRSVKRLQGRMVEVQGFIVPIDVDSYIDMIKEFLLVPNPLACIHFPPPAPNQIIFIRMKEAIPLDMDYRGVAIKGRFIIPELEEGDFVSFELEGVSAKEANIEFDDPYEFLEY